MQKTTLRDANSRILGYVVAHANGEKKLYNANMRLLGYYKPVPNMTYDANMRQVARGDQLLILLR